MTLGELLGWMVGLGVALLVDWAVLGGDLWSGVATALIFCGLGISFGRRWL